MALSNAERQRLYIRRLKEKAVTNGGPVTDADREAPVPKHPTKAQVATALHLLEHALDNDCEEDLIIEWCEGIVDPDPEEIEIDLDEMPFDDALDLVGDWLATLSSDQRDDVLGLILTGQKTRKGAGSTP